MPPPGTPQACDPPPQNDRKATGRKAIRLQQLMRIKPLIQDELEAVEHVGWVFSVQE